MEQPDGWYDGELVSQFLAKLKSQTLSWVVFIWGLYYLVPRAIRSLRKARESGREAIETLRTLIKGIDLLGTFFEQLDKEKLGNLVRLEREMGEGNVVEKLHEIELMLLCEVNTRRASMSLSGRAFWEADAEGAFTFVSPGFARLFAASQDDCIGNGWLAFIQDGDRQRVKESWFEAVKQVRQFHCFWGFTRSDGNVASVIGNASPVYDPRTKKFKFLGMVGVMQEGKMIESGAVQRLKE